MTEHMVQVCVAIMAILGTVLLGLEQHDLVLPLTTIFVATTSVIFTDRLHWFSLHRFLANAVAVLAVMYTVVQLAGQPTESQLLAVANLLVYLQVVLFYQLKTIRLYWQLITLSLLQVVVAAALNLVFIFGILLVIYLFVALVALSSFYLHRESLQFAWAAGGAGPAVAAGLPLASAGAGGAVRPRRDLSASTIIWQAVWFGSLTLVTTALVFFFLPRQEAWWKKRSLRGQRFVGFSEEVNLEQLGPILESDEMVMRVSFTDLLTNEPYRLWGEPYFRGAVLSEYQPGSGIWRRPSWGRREGALPLTGSTRGLVRQDITLDPGDHSVIFSIPPVSAVRETPTDLLIEHSSLTVIPKDPDRMDPKSKYRFVAATGAFQRGIQNPLLPDRVPLRELLSDFGNYVKFNDAHRAALPTVDRLAHQILTAAQLEDDDLLGKVRALEAHFLAAGHYRYTLNNSDKRDTSLDPIEDFVGNHRSGHCEYFASALALMLRSQNIPARLVIGYKGGEFNSVGNYFQVRQLHAHAWVECYVTPDQMAAISPSLDPSTTGGWLRLDPTPSTIDPLAGIRDSGILGRLGHLADYAQLLWNDYVVGLDSQRQKESIYRPLVSGARATLEGLFSRVVWEERWAALMTHLGLSPSAARGPANYVIRILIGVVLSLFLTGFLLRRWLARWFRWSAITVHWTMGTRRNPDDFYRRLERVIARLGSVRGLGQTPRELVRQVEPQLAGSAYIELPALIVDAFYRMRFGGQSLDKLELDQLQHALAAWERDLAGRRI